MNAQQEVRGWMVPDFYLDIAHHLKQLGYVPILPNCLPLSDTLHPVNGIPDINFVWKADTDGLTIWIWLALVTASLVAFSMTLYRVVKRTSN